MQIKAILMASAMVIPGAAWAQENIDLTIASSHPTAIPWVGMMQTHFMAETDRLLAETGNYKITWNEAFGGTLYKANATLSSVEQGVTDVGWVFSLLEGAELPLSQVSSYAPFATNNPPVQLAVMQELIDTIPELKAEWESHNLVVLGLTGTDSYDLYAKKPISSLADLNGMKISAPGVLGTWLSGTGANPVDGALTTFYTDIQTGVSDGVLSLALGVFPAKIYEVAPYITKVQMGTAFSGAIAINKDSWDALPEEVQDAMRKAGAYYTEAHGKDLLERPVAVTQKIIEAGATQNPPVTLAELPQDQREAWVNALPDLAGNWARDLDAKGLPGTTVMNAYMAGLKARGETPVRDWKAE
ncbi:MULTISPECIES: C4-dicarboxylate TRAP transporter substrate-binding protein [Tabrizicola]|uniref:C4-dicarboxylate TRAP transporter substrate-binding protein n=1 Tax=Tabrizicola TaxID=1443919 RepID=UPI001B7D8EB9|nr:MULTISPECIES: C4-dicarboxylate TRAP transporter substrate-binding protein [Paracoccaceae]